MNMKSIAYWAATTLIALETFVGGITDLLHGGTELIAGPPVVGIVTHLGYPVYILSILGVWKLLGAVVIVAPGLPRLKEWAYAGSFLQITAAAVSHAIVGSDVTMLIYPIVVTVVTLTSWALRPPDRMLRAAT